MLSFILRYQSKRIIKAGCLQKNLYPSFVKQTLFYLTSYLFAVTDEHETGEILHWFDHRISFTIHKIWHRDCIVVHPIETNLFCFRSSPVFDGEHLRYLSPGRKSLMLIEGSINDHFWFSKYKRTSIVVVSQTRAHYNKYKSIKTLSKISSVFHLLFLNHKSRMWCKYYHLFISVAANFWVLRYDFILNMLAGNESIKSQITWAADVHGHIWETRVVNRRSYLSFIVTGLKFVAPCIVFC